MKTETIKVKVDIDVQAIENFAESYFFLLELGPLGRGLFAWIIKINIKKFVRIRNERNKQQGVQP